MNDSFHAGLASNTTPAFEVTVAPTSTYIDRVLPSVVAMLILFLLSALGNVTVFSTLVASRSRKTRISIIILHLTVADLFVTFILIPTEIGWRIFRYWLAGNVACKIFAFLRAFGFYLSSMVLIVVSLDRYIAIIYPLRANSEFAKRGHIMLMAAWAISALCSIPQAFMWNTQPAPKSPNMEQCVTFGSDPLAVTTFTLFFLATVYFIPLIIMVFTYSRILSTIIKQSSDFRQAAPPENQLPPIGSLAQADGPLVSDVLINHSTHGLNGHTQALLHQHLRNGSSSFGTMGGPQRGRALSSSDGLARISGEARALRALSNPSQSGVCHNNNSRCSSNARIVFGNAVTVAPPLPPPSTTLPQPMNGRCGGSRENFRSSHFNRARARTLRMTVLIVLAFILCWTPNVVMSLWFLIDSESAMKSVDPRVADVLFILTITNSVVNPYVYGSYASEMRTKCLKWFGFGRSRDRMGGNGTIGLGATGSLLSQGPGNNSATNQVRGYCNQIPMRSARFTWKHPKSRGNQSHCSLRSSRSNPSQDHHMNGVINIRATSPTHSADEPPTLGSANLNFPNFSATSPTSDGNAVHLQFSSSSVSESFDKKIVNFTKKSQKTKRRQRFMKRLYCRGRLVKPRRSSENLSQPPMNSSARLRIPRSQSVMAKLPSWQDAPKGRHLLGSCIIGHLDDMPEDISILDTSPVWSPVISRKSSARSRQSQRWTKFKRCRSLSELKIYL